MVTRTRSLRAMREQMKHAEAIEQQAANTDASAPTETKVKKSRTRKVAAEKSLKVRAAAKPRTKKPKVQPRMVAQWAVCDGGLKRLAIFDYKDRAGADMKLAELKEQKKGTFVLQLVKVLYEPPPLMVEPIIAV